MKKSGFLPPLLQLPFQAGPRGDNSGDQRSGFNGDIGAVGVGGAWEWVEVCGTSQRVDTGLGSSEPGQVRGVLLGVRKLDAFLPQDPQVYSRLYFIHCFGNLRK